MSAKKEKRDKSFLPLATVAFVVTIAALFGLTRPKPQTPTRVTEVVRLPGELQPVRDESTHYPPGSPEAVAEAFLRYWWRSHYEDAARLSTGGMRARCERDLTKTRGLTPDEREQMRQVQVIAEAAAFDLERAMVSELPPDANGRARREVRGDIHAHGMTPDGRRVESRRAQVLRVEMVDGNWRVAEWTPVREDAGISVQ